MNPKFELLMAVYSLANGAGTVVNIPDVHIAEGEPYPVMAGFGGLPVNFTLDGKKWEEDKHPILFILPGPVPMEVGMRVFDPGKLHGTVEKITGGWAEIAWDYGGRDLCDMDGKYDPKQPNPSVLIPAGDGK